MRLTEHARGGGCACKIPPGELRSMVAGLRGQRWPQLLVGLDGGDDCAAVRLDAPPTGPTTGPAGPDVRVEGGVAILATADFFAPVVDDAYDFGRIAAANALSDVYASGGTPIVALNLLAWPRETLGPDLAAEVLRGGLAVTTEAGCPLAGGHSIDAAEPTYGLAVTGVADPDRLLRNDAATPGTPLTLTKPLGLGVLNARHKQTGEVFPEAVAVMTTLNAEASRTAVAQGIRAATDVTGFGLLGHLHAMALASGVAARIDPAAVPYVDGARASTGFASGGTRRNLDWVRPYLDTDVDADELLLLADAQTSGGLLVCGELPGHPVVGEVVAGRHGGIRIG